VPEAKFDITKEKHQDAHGQENKIHVRSDAFNPQRFTQRSLLGPPGSGKGTQAPVRI
jgi:hypothetical protein